MQLTIEDRAREIAAFLAKPYEECLAKLSLGFGPLHNEVTADWKRANPQTDDEILEWYRTTEAYIWSRVRIISTLDSITWAWWAASARRCGRRECIACCVWATASEI